jgi:hypothetical protein
MRRHHHPVHPPVIPQHSPLRRRRVYRLQDSATARLHDEARHLRRCARRSRTQCAEHDDGGLNYVPRIPNPYSSAFLSTALVFPYTPHRPSHHGRGVGLSPG